MRTVSILNPFTAGIVSDRPSYSIASANSAFAQDGFSPSHVFRNRLGWAFDGTTADVADNLVGIYRAQFALADVTRTLTGDDDGDLFIHNPAGAGTAIFTDTVAFLPRAMYHDELIFCAQDGQTPLRRYSGASANVYTNAASQYEINEARITATASNYGSPQVGMYFYARTGAGVDRASAITYRVIEVNSSTSLTIEDIYSVAFGVDTPAANPVLSATGSAWAGVGVYSAGTVTVAGTAGTGIGTKWSTGAWGSVISDTTGSGDCLLCPTNYGTSAGRVWGASPISAVGSDTGITVQGMIALAGQPYQIVRRCPFKDAAAHKGSLWGTGVAQYPNRVYVSPPGWNPSFPPGFTLPFDPTAEVSSSNTNDFLLDFIDVPAPYDGDHNVAILESPNPLLVLKRHAVYGIYGSFGGLSVDQVADGIGCIDIRSAHSYDEGQFWAGETGIFWYRTGQIVDLTQQDPDGRPNPKINREWRALTHGFDYGTSDYCTTWLASGHLFVHITTSGGTSQRTYICDLRDGSWQSRITNLSPRYGFTSRVPGEREKALVVQDIDQGRVIDTAPMLDGTGIAKDGDGTSPRLQAWTTSALGQAQGIAGRTRLIDLHVHANVYDAGAAGATRVAVSATSEGGIGNPASSTKVLSPISSDSVDQVDRHKRRVARQGRRHQVRIDNDLVGTNTNATKVEIHQIDAIVRDDRQRS